MEYRAEYGMDVLAELPNARNAKRCPSWRPHRRTNYQPAKHLVDDSNASVKVNTKKIIAGLALFCLAFVVNAQEPAAAPESLSTVPDSSIPTIEQLKEQRAAVEADTSLSEAQKATALTLYDRALQATRTIAELDEQGTELRRRVAAAPARIDELVERLKQETQEFDITPERFADTPTEVLIKLTETARRNFESAWETLLARRSAIRQLSLRPLVAPGSLEGELASSADETASGTLGADGGVDAVAIAREHWQTARAAVERARRRLARERLASFDLLIRISFLEIESAVLEVRRLTAEHESLARALDARYAEEARVAREKAEEIENALLQMPDAMWRVARDTSVIWREIEQRRLPVSCARPARA